MKVGIMTLLGRTYNDNYGGVFQNLALNRHLSSLGISTYTIDLNPFYNLSRDSYLRRFIKITKRKGPRYIFNRLRHEAVNLPLYRNRDMENKRHNKFNEFRSRHISFSERAINPYNIIDGDIDYLNDFDVLIVGSDQVWNPNFNEKMLKFMLLDFPFAGVKSSYAASIGANIPIILSDLYNSNLNKFHHLSVRDDYSKMMLEKATGLKAKVVLDPVNLLSKERWMEYAKEPDLKVKGPYLFVYDLVRTREIIPALKKLVNINKVSIVNYFPYSEIEKRLYHIETNSFYTCGPDEFLWLLDNSSGVISSSYHGVVLSVLFRKNFIAILPSKKSNLSGMHSNERIIEFLKQLNLEDRALIDVEKIPGKLLYEDINWSHVLDIHSKMREESIDYLNNVLAIRK